MLPNSLGQCNKGWWNKNQFEMALMRRRIWLDIESASKYNQQGISWGKRSSNMPESENNASETENLSTAKARPNYSRLGSTTKFVGELTCQEDVIIEGAFQGKIDSKDYGIHIEKNALVKADIRGKNIAISGKVSGNISATEKIIIRKGALMTGDLSAPRISIEEGAQFKGTVKMLPATR
jgi:cytoskeletal protein CcmA (bactofilin family)